MYVPETSAPTHSPRIRLATAADRDAIYRLRREAFADELGQYSVTADGRLTDTLDDVNDYLLAEVRGTLAGFISITRGSGALSLDKYVDRSALPFAITGSVYELRILTVARRFRRARIANLLMYAAFRLLEERRADRIVAMGRSDLAGSYQRFGLERSGVTVQAGPVAYEVLSAPMTDFSAHAETLTGLRARLNTSGWELPFPVRREPVCFHGGVSIERAGPRLGTPDPGGIVNADVLDAWFPPAPSVIAAVSEHIEWALRTSPSAYSSGL